MAQWHRAALEADFVNQHCVTVAGRELALIRHEGQVYALDNVCSHEYSRLCEGEVYDGKVYCPKHGSAFALADGAVLSFPATRPVGSYAVELRAGEIWVKL